MFSYLNWYVNLYMAGIVPLSKFNCLIFTFEVDNANFFITILVAP